MSIYQTACKLIGEENCRIWFTNNNFFSTTYIGPIIHEYYFITYDDFIKNIFWSLRYINIDTKTIDTIEPSPLNSKETCIELLEYDCIKKLLLRA